MEIQKYIDEITLLIIERGPTLLLAIVVLVVGLWLIGRLMKYINGLMKKSHLNADVQPFLRTLISVILKVLLFFSVAQMVGVETTSFVALLAAAGFAIGMAFQGSLSNFASGVMILVFRPYKVGDLIEVNDELGFVREIQVFNTIIETFNHVHVIIPNSAVLSDKIKNFSESEHLRIDLNVSMPYNESFDKVKSIILNALSVLPSVEKDPEPFVGIENFDSHNIVLAVRPFATVDNYWDAYFQSHEAVKKALGENGIEVAYSEGVELGKISQ